MKKISSNQFENVSSFNSCNLCRVMYYVIDQCE